MPDLPTLLASVHENPDDGPRWLALAAWYAANGREDEAVAMRMFWPALRENVAAGDMTVDWVLADLTAHAATLAAVAREVEAGRAARIAEQADYGWAGGG
jgi:hypothetical protein